MRSHIFTNRPWLAADPTLGPWPEPEDPEVVQTGAWILSDERPLPAELEAFVKVGEPPVYFGFGSIRAPGEDVGHLGIGVAHPQGMPTADSLATALSHALEPDVAARARSIAATVRTDGAQAAAQRLMASD